MIHLQTGLDRDVVFTDGPLAVEKRFCLEFEMIQLSSKTVDVVGHVTRGIGGTGTDHRTLDQRGQIGHPPGR